MVRSSVLVVGLVTGGCSQGTVGGNPFGASDSMVPMEDEDDEQSATDPGDESASGSTSGVISESFSSGGTDPSTGDSGDVTTGDASTEAVSASDPSSSSTEPAAESSSSGDAPDGGQPATGMYAHCYDMFFDNCDDASPICVNITGDMDGYCTADGCANPALDCDPAPGGTAQPFCFAAGGYSVCGLDCSSGESCATGMTCTLISFDGMTNYSVCM